MCSHLHIPFTDFGSTLSLFSPQHIDYELKAVDDESHLANYKLYRTRYWAVIETAIFQMTGMHNASLLKGKLVGYFHSFYILR